jgi:hypothetical protein
LPSARCTPPCTPTPILEQLQQQQSQQAEAVGTSSRIVFSLPPRVSQVLWGLKTRRIRTSVIKASENSDWQVFHASDDEMQYLALLAVRALYSTLYPDSDSRTTSTTDSIFPPASGQSGPLGFENAAHTHLGDQGLGEPPSSSPIGRSGHLERERPTPHLFHRPAAANSASFGGFGFFGCGLQLVKEEGEGERSEERRGREATSVSERPKISSSLSGEFRYYETLRPMSPQADPNVISPLLSDEMPYGSPGGGVKVMGK